VPDITPQRQAVLLLAHGTPQSLDEIPAYLRNITSGRPMPESVVEEIRHRYSLIGSSPLTELTQEQGRLLSQALGCRYTWVCVTGSPTSPMSCARCEPTALPRQL